MFPMLLMLGRQLPILGDIIAAFEGKPETKKAAERERPRPQRREGGGGGGRPPPKRYAPDF